MSVAKKYFLQGCYVVPMKHKLYFIAHKTIA